MRFVHGFIAIIQFILHYLALAGIILGVIALLVGNTERGWTLVVGGVSFMALKYIIGFVYIGAIKMFSKDSQTEQQK